MFPHASITVGTSFRLVTTNWPNRKLRHANAILLHQQKQSLSSKFLGLACNITLKKKKMVLLIEFHLQVENENKIYSKQLKKMKVHIHNEFESLIVHIRPKIIISYRKSKKLKLSGCGPTMYMSILTSRALNKTNNYITQLTCSPAQLNTMALKISS